MTGWYFDVVEPKFVWLPKARGRPEDLDDDVVSETLPKLPLAMSGIVGTGPHERCNCGCLDGLPPPSQHALRDADSVARHADNPSQERRPAGCFHENDVAELWCRQTLRKRDVPFDEGWGHRRATRLDEFEERDAKDHDR